MNYLISVFIILMLCSGLSRASEIRERVYLEAQHYKVDRAVLMAIAKVESDLDIRITNWGDRGEPSRGLFQIKFSTAKDHCNIKQVKSLYMLKWNTKCAAKYLKYQLDRYKGNYFKAILAYNAGGFYICNKRHIERWKKKEGKHCILGQPVNLTYFNKVYNKLKKINVIYIENVDGDL